VDPITAYLQMVFFSNKINCFLQTENLKLIITLILLRLAEEELSNFFIEAWHRLGR